MTPPWPAGRVSARALWAFATPVERLGDRAGRLPSRWVRAVILLCALVLVVATAEIVLDGAVGHSPLIPKRRRSRAGCSGVGERLGLPRLPDRDAGLLGAYAVLLGLVGHLNTLGDRAGRRAAADRVRRADPDVDRRVQLHRLRADGRRARVNPYTHGPIAITARRGLPLRRARIGSTSTRHTARCTRCSPTRSACSA